MKTAEIRSEFLQYFAAHNHSVVPSASLVPVDDPTLLFVNAGMVPFKDAFTGAAEPPGPRAVSSQRCLRVSGKHNDLAEVGRTPRHHTLFEMLGNFSFGDYFKEEAISFAWEFLVDVLKLSPDRLAFTVFSGEDGLPADEEAGEMWPRLTGCSPDRVLGFGKEDNFWSMGDTGPCGPCSEIHYDLGPQLDGSVNEGDRWMEIWNLVFMQYNRDSAGALTPLPAPSIDTGMGLERIASAVQGKLSNYEGDLFAQVLAGVSSVTGCAYDGGHSDDAVSMRVIADHARATALLLADGVLPDRTGRGYVLRKIMRRAVSQGVLLGVDRPFLAEAAGVVVEAMSDAFPILAEKEDALRTAAAQEEALFRRTVEEGMRRISDLEDQLEDESVWSLGPEGERILSGEVAFRLYDTYGCPLELTASVGVRRGYEVDEDGFLREMTRQKERSRKSWKGGGAPAVLDGFYASRRAVLGETRFTGYAEQEGEARVLAMARWSGDGLEEADRASEGDPVALVMESTPFYGEAGGQVGDTGELTGDGVRVRVEDTRRTAGGSLIVHMGRVEEGELSPGMRLTQSVDRSRREEVQRHHSATHLLHHALREVLGGHVSQKGSFVGQERLRFDFSHPEAVAPAALAEVEARVNELIRENHAVSTEETDPDSARAAGALAFFGEKYGDTVRVVGMGPSRELCGGTHVASTGDLGYCALVAEGSVASGVRRVEAFAGSPAVVAAWRARAELERIAGVLRTAPADVLARLGDLQEETRNLKARIEELERDAAGSVADRLVAAAVEASGTRVVAGVAPISERGALRDLADEIRLSAERTVVVLGATLDEKVALAAAVSDDLVKEGRIKAGDLVGRVAELVGGGGGGKPHLATAGGRDVAGLPGALEEVPGIVEALMSESAS